MTGEPVVVFAGRTINGAPAENGPLSASASELRCGDSGDEVRVPMLVLRAYFWLLVIFVKL